MCFVFFFRCVCVYVSELMLMLARPERQMTVAMANWPFTPSYMLIHLHTLALNDTAFQHHFHSHPVTFRMLVDRRQIKCFEKFIISLLNSIKLNLSRTAAL